MFQMLEIFMLFILTNTLKNVFQKSIAKKKEKKIKSIIKKNMDIMDLVTKV